MGDGNGELIEARFHAEQL